MIDVEKNLLTTLLLAVSGLCAVAILVFAGLYLLTDVKYVSKATQGELVFSEVQAPDRGLSELASYVAIVERPVFFPDRQLPEIDLEATEELATDEEAPVVVATVEPLRAVVAGIIITPEEKIAMVNDEVAGKVVVMREGMRLAGDQSAWQLDEILDRATNFSSSDGRQTTLQLKVKTDGLDTNHRAMTSGAQAGADGQSASRAEMIRQRVAERREELRQRAEQQRRRGKKDDEDDDKDTDQ